MNHKPVVGRNDVSRVHHLAEALRKRELVDADGSWMGEADDLDLFSPLKTFLVTRDWTDLMGGDDWQLGQVQLPYPHCSFEFILDGIPVTLMCLQLEGEEASFLPCICINGLWSCVDAEIAKETPIMQFAWSLTMACCIALEAEVLSHEVVRAPHKLNAKREKQGKAPMMDFHVIDLKRRARVECAPNGEPSRHVRLHFRRGHWRHYEDHKTWIKWQLVGDPSLGIVQSRYSA